MKIYTTVFLTALQKIFVLFWKIRAFECLPVAMLIALGGRIVIEARR